jgi:hypothetical protein
MVACAGVQHALPALAPGRRRSLLGAVRALAGRVGAGTPVRAACLRFQGAFLSCPDTLQADPATVLPLIDEAEAASWLQVRSCIRISPFAWLLLHACMLGV